MKDRKKRINKKKDSNYSEAGYQYAEAQKLLVVDKFTDNELQEMLNQSNKTNDLEIVSLLIGKNSLPEEVGLL
jgi:hypothetical protein